MTNSWLPPIISVIEETGGAKLKKRRSISILFVTLVVNMMGFGIIIPILPFYVESLGASGTELGLLMATFAFMQFLFAPVWGELSDRYGRRSILMVGILGNGISQLFFGLSTELWMLFASRALAGMLSSATLPTAMAYIGDSTSDEERGEGMGLLGAAMGVGMVLGPGVGGWLATQQMSLPFFVAAGLSLLVLVFVYFALPESLPREKRVHKGTGVRGPQLDEMWHALFGPVGYLLVFSFLVSFGLTNFEGVFGLYALQRYQYGPERVGTILMVIGLLSAVVQGALTGPLTRRWGEAAIIKASLLGSAVGFVLMLAADTYAMVILTVGFFIISNALLRPAISTMISRQAIGGQGMVMGLNNSFMSLGRIVGPTWAGIVFDVNMGFPYISGSVIMLAGYFLTFLWLKPAMVSPVDDQIGEQEPIV